MFDREFYLAAAVMGLAILASIMAAMLIESAWTASNACALGLM